MGQKVHPLGFRIGVTKKHSSNWFAKGDQYSSFLKEDNFLRNLLKKKYLDSSISEIKIDRKLSMIFIDIFTARPALISVESDNLNSFLSYEILKNFGSEREIFVNVIEILEPDIYPKLLAEFMGEQLEKRVPFRRVVRSAIRKAQLAEVSGIKIQISGRLNGAEIARSEWVRNGQVPLHTLRANINYYCHSAHTIYGTLGIKIWIFVSSNDKY